MKKRVFTAALLTAMVLQSIPAFAAEYEQRLMMYLLRTN